MECHLTAIRQGKRVNIEQDEGKVSASVTPVSHWGLCSWLLALSYMMIIVSHYVGAGNPLVSEAPAGDGELDSSLDYLPVCRDSRFK